MYLDRIRNECENFRMDANKMLKDMSEVISEAEYMKKRSMSLHSTTEIERLRPNLQENFNRITLCSEGDRKMVSSMNNKLALTAFTNDTMQSDADKGEAEEIRTLNQKLSKLEDMINKISNTTEDDATRVILKGLEDISNKLDGVAVTQYVSQTQQAVPIGQAEARVCSDKCKNNLQKIIKQKESLKGYKEVS